MILKEAYYALEFLCGNIRHEGNLEDWKQEENGTLETWTRLKLGHTGTGEKTLETRRFGNEGAAKIRTLETTEH